MIGSQYAEFEQLWDEFDPYGYHIPSDDLCPGCDVGTKPCKCGGLYHSTVHIISGEKTVEYLCDNCGRTHTTGGN